MYSTWPSTASSKLRRDAAASTLFGVINNAKAGIIMLLIKNRLSGGDYPKCMEKNMAERSQKFPIIEKITEASSRGDLTTFEYDRITRNKVFRFYSMFIKWYSVVILVVIK
jgi:hypothetical protein